MPLDPGDVRYVSPFELEQEKYVAERGTVMDIVHDLWAGTGQALELLGRGTSSETIQKMGEGIQSTELAKPDSSQHYGTQGRLGRVVDGIFEMAPLTVGLMGTTAAGALAGPVGAAAGFTSGMSILGKGTFDQAYEEISIEKPDLPQKDRFDYAMKTAASAVGTEVIGQALPFGIGKYLSKGASKKVLGELLNSGRVSTDQLISASIKTKGGKEVVKGLFGGAAADGTSEVVNELIQAANRESYGLEENPVDLIDLFLIGSAPGGLIAGGTLAKSAHTKKNIRNKLGDDLASEDAEVRVGAVNAIGEALGNLSPELGQAYISEVQPKAVEGKVAITEEVLGDQIVKDKILNNPSELLKDSGIPSKDTSVPLKPRIVSTPIMPEIAKEPTQAQRLAEAEVMDRTSLDEPTVPVVPSAETIGAAQAVERGILDDVDGPEARLVRDFMGTTKDTSTFEDYKKAMREEAVASAMYKAMGEVIELTNDLKNPNLSLEERKDIKKAKDKKEVLIREEIEDAKGTEDVVEQELAAGEGLVQEEDGRVEADVVAPIATEETIEKVPLKATEEAVESTLEETDAKVPEEVQEATEEPPMTPEQSKLAMGWLDVVSAEDAMLLAKRGEPVTKETVEVEELKDDKGFVASRFTDGSTIERGTSDTAKKFKVNIKGLTYRASSRKAATEAIKGDNKLELWEDKAPETMLTKKREPLTDTQKRDISAFLEDNTVASVTKGMRMPDKEGFFALALGDVTQSKKKLTPGNVRERMTKLAKAEENTSEVTRKAKEDISVESVSAEELFAKDEAAATAEDARELLEVEDTEVLESESKADTVYIQKDKQKYTLKEQWVTPEGKKVAKAKRTAKDTKKLSTADGRFEVVAAPRKKGDPVKVSLVKEGVDQGILFNNPTEAMEYAKASEEDLSIDKDGAETDSRFPDGYSLLESVVRLGNDVETSLAKMLLKGVSEDKLKSLVIKVGHKNSHKDGIITLKKSALPGTRLHEVVHGITVDELMKSPEMSGRLKKLMKTFREQVAKDGLLSKDDIELLNKIETSSDFINSGQKWSNEGLAYALLNEKEFLSQAFSSSEVQDVMRSIKIEKKTLWKRLVSFVSDVLKLPKDAYTMLEEVISIVPEIAKIPVAQRSSVEYASIAPDIQETTDAIMRQEKEKGRWKRKVTDHLKEIVDLAEEFARPISDRLKEYSPRLQKLLMKTEARLTTLQKGYNTKVEPFLRWYSNLSDQQKILHSLALMNSNLSESKKIIDAIPKDIMEPLNEVLDDLKKRGNEVALDIGSEDYYFPRRVKDIQGLMDKLSEDSDDKGGFYTAFQQERKALGLKDGEQLSEDQKIQVITNMMQTGNHRQIKRPGGAKERSVPFVDQDTYAFYEEAPDALVSHIFEMNEKVGMREFIGASTRKQRINDLEKKRKAIDKMEDGQEKREAEELFEIKASELEDIEAGLREELSAVVYKEMKGSSSADQRKVIEILESRMKQKGAHGIVDTFRNVGYIATMGNFLSALTQLSDIPIVFYAHRQGSQMDNLKSVAEAASDIFKIATGQTDTGAFTEEADFTNALREFSQGSTSSKWVEWVFKYSGLKYTDLLGKEAFMKAAYKKFQKADNKDLFMNKYEPMFGKDTEAVWDSFQKGERSEDVTTVLISELSDFQPVTLSQQSQRYLTGGNLRIAYMLKTFSMRTTSAALMEASEEIKAGNVAKGVAKAVTILMIYAAAGASADELKDLIRNRPSDISDNVYDNILQLFFLNRFSMEKGVQQEGVFKAFLSNLLPPVRFMDNLAADAYAIFSDEKDVKWKSKQLLPFVGTTWYARGVEGQESSWGMERKSILKKVRENKKKGRGAYSGNLSAKIKTYNKNVSRDKKITAETIRRSYNE